MTLGIADRLLAFVGALEDRDERDTVVLAGPVVLNAAATLGLAAVAVERAEQSGIVLAGGPPEVSFLADGTGSDSFDTPMHRRLPVRAQWPALRHVARTASWSPPWRLLRAFLRPDATAVTHNPILRAYARSGRLAVQFRQAERILDTAGMPPDPVAADADSELAARLIGALLSLLSLDASRKAPLGIPATGSSGEVCCKGKGGTACGLRMAQVAPRDLARLRGQRIRQDNRRRFPASRCAHYQLRSWRRTFSESGPCGSNHARAYGGRPHCCRDGDGRRAGAASLGHSHAGGDARSVARRR